jgi:hypothetical protein
MQGAGQQGIALVEQHSEVLMPFFTDVQACHLASGFSIMRVEVCTAWALLKAKNSLCCMLFCFPKQSTYCQLSQGLVIITVKCPSTNVAGSCVHAIISKDKR